jgi:hypothetical protein
MNFWSGQERGFEPPVRAQAEMPMCKRGRSEAPLVPMYLSSACRRARVG